MIDLVRCMFCALAIATSTACSAEPSCHAKGCTGAPTTIPFVDDAGNQVAASGELREGGEGSTPLAFSCGAEAPHAQFPATCNANPRGVSLEGVVPSSTVEVRFQLQDGTLSAWQPVQLPLVAHTIEDFNGPGCPCTYYTGDATPIVVPSATQ